MTKTFTWGEGSEKFKEGMFVRYRGGSTTVYRIFEINRAGSIHIENANGEWVDSVEANELEEVPADQVEEVKKWRLKPPPEQPSFLEKRKNATIGLPSGKAGKLPKTNYSLWRRSIDTD